MTVLVRVRRIEKRRDDHEVTAADIANLIEDWGKWKRGWSVSERAGDRPDVRMPFGPRTPAGVWMTPVATVRKYQEVTEGWTRLQRFPKEAIRVRFIDGLDKNLSCLDLGTDYRGLDTYTQKGFAGIALWLNKVRRHRC